MADHDAVIVPSRYENFCNVALEAMAAGRAVLGSRCGGIPDLVEERVTGFLFEPGSVSALRVKVQSALDAPEELSRMGASGWKKARNYSWQRIGRETDELLREFSLRPRST
jgi:glycosyltransferase involved in cell wall biosynthesis